jgi:hypothetical protein
MLRFSVHPSTSSPRRKAMTRATTSGSPSAYGCRNAMRRMRSPGTPAAKGCAAAALANKVMNSRRFNLSNRIWSLGSRVGSQDIELSSAPHASRPKDRCTA